MDKPTLEQLMIINNWVCVWESSKTQRCSPEHCLGREMQPWHQVQFWGDGFGFDKPLIRGVVLPLASWGLLGGIEGTQDPSPQSPAAIRHIPAWCLGPLGGVGVPPPTLCCQEGQEWSPQSAFAQLCRRPRGLQPPGDHGDRHKASLGWEGRMEKG